MTPEAKSLSKAGSKSSNFGPVSSGLLQRKCACGGSPGTSGECENCQGKRLQRKLTIGSSNDPLEIEADRVANQVMANSGRSAIGSVPPRIQRYSGTSSGQVVEAPASVEQVLAGSGRPLEPSVRVDMEQRFGHDLSSVRVHSDSVADRSARDVNAVAYTVGRAIVFANGLYSPTSSRGRRLLAHELTHVIQQSRDEKSATASTRKTQNVVPKAPHPRLLQRQQLRLNLPRVQLKSAGNADISDLVDALPSALTNGQQIAVKTINIKGVTHKFLLSVTIIPGAPPPTAAEVGSTRDLARQTSQQLIEHLVPVTVYQTLPNPINTLFHELVHARLIIDRYLPEASQSQTYRKYALNYAAASDSGLLAITGNLPKKNAVLAKLGELRNWFRSFVPGFVAPPELSGQQDDATLEFLINEKFTNDLANRAFPGRSTVNNLTIARRYTNALLGRFRNAAQTQGLFSQLLAAEARTKATTSMQSDEEVSSGLAAALSVLYDMLDSQAPAINQIAQAPQTQPSTPRNVPSPTFSPIPP